MRISRYDEFIVEQLPQQHTVDQWKKLRKITKGIDIGDRTRDEYKNSANLNFISNVVDTGIESYQDYMKSNIDWDEKNPIKNQTKNTRVSELPQMKKKYPSEKIGQKK
jgi:hypothetical protein